MLNVVYTEEELKEIQNRKDHLIEVLIIISGFMYVGFFRFDTGKTTTLGLVAFLFLLYAVITLAFSINPFTRQYNDLLYAGAAILFSALIASFFVFSGSLITDSDITNQFLYLMWFIVFFLICHLITLGLEYAFIYPSKLNNIHSLLLSFQSFLIWLFLVRIFDAMANSNLDDIWSVAVFSLLLFTISIMYILKNIRVLNYLMALAKDVSKEIVTGERVCFSLIVIDILELALVSIYIVLS